MAAGDWFGDIIGNASSSGGWKSNTTTTYTEDKYKKVFYKMISRILGSNTLSQDIKDGFINASMDIKEFRGYVAEYFPQYAEKIKLWEKLHNGQS